MPAFTTIALKIALASASASTAQLGAPIADIRYGPLIYEVRAVNDGRGIGGSPAYCASATDDLVMMVYTVRNTGENPRSAPSVPPLIMIDQQGALHRRDPVLTDALARKLLPNLAIRNGVLESGQLVVLADVFVTPKRAIRNFAWRFRAEPNITTAVKLPQATRADPPDC